MKHRWVLMASIALVAAGFTLPASPASAALKPIWHPEYLQPITVTDPTNSVSSAPAKASQTTQPGGSTVSSMAILAGGSTSCTSGWHYVAAKADSFVTGNCYQGWALTASYIQWDAVHSEFWYGGAIGGHYNGCGWMREQDLGAFSGYDSSSCGNRAYCDYIYCDASGNPYTYGSATDGMTASSIAGCNEWANYRPWSANGVPVDSVRQTNGFLNDLKVRYLAKYTYGGHRYYMARDTTVTANNNQANWVFLRDDCLS